MRTSVDCEREAASMAISQLSSQVDFVNTRCADLERSVRTQTAVETIVRHDEEERPRLLTLQSLQSSAAPSPHTVWRTMLGGWIRSRRCVPWASECAASALSLSRLLLSPSARAVQVASRCSARAQLTALTGVSLAFACSFSPLSISAAGLALGSSGAGRIALLDARSAHRPHGRVARLRLQLQLSLHLGCCSRLRL